jgi:hypothetical protein
VSDDARCFSHLKFMGGEMASQNEGYKHYARYAEHCLSVAHQLTDQESRRLHREMAADG